MLKNLNIQFKQNIVNFDETDFCINCFEFQKILMFDEIKKFYVVSFENKKSFIMIKTVNAIEKFSIFSFVIMSDPEIMIN